MTGVPFDATSTLLQRNITLRYITLHHYTTFRCITLLYITLHYIAFGRRISKSALLHWPCSRNKCFENLTQLQRIYWSKKQMACCWHRTPITGIEALQSSCMAELSIQAGLHFSAIAGICCLVSSWNGTPIVQTCELLFSLRLLGWKVTADCVCSNAVITALHQSSPWYALTAIQPETSGVKRYRWMHQQSWLNRPYDNIRLFPVLSPRVE